MGKRIAAIVLAAGYSSRMGAFKPLLPLGDATVLERVVTLFHDAGIGDVRVVLGHRASDLLSLVEKLHARPVMNNRYHDGMFSSVVAGVTSIEPDIDAFFLLPVDIPLVKKYTVESLLRVYTQGGSGILYPCLYGKRGHPPLIPARHRDHILSWQGEGGLKSCLARYESDAVPVEVADECILVDMDTMEDYGLLYTRWESRGVPTVLECEALLNNIVRVDERLLRHSRAVARLSCLLVDELNWAGYVLDRDLVLTSALLHDIAKGRSGHAGEGARILREMGFPDVADIVACHMDISLKEHDTISEKEIVYLADKMTDGDRFVSIETRFASRTGTLARDPDILEAVSNRLENALRIRERVETKLGRSLDEVLKSWKL